jgi:hypothetical protein
MTDDIRYGGTYENPEKIPDKMKVIENGRQAGEVKSKIAFHIPTFLSFA